MFIGHFALSFLLIYFLLDVCTNVETKQVIRLSLISGIYGLVADLDIIFAFVETLLFVSETGNITIEAFWNISRKFHRKSTHSLVVGLLSIIGIVIQFIYIDDVAKPYENITIDYGISILFGGLIGMLTGNFARGVLVSGLFVFCILSVTRVILYKTLFNKNIVLVSAFVGILSHPFGDVFTGTPPNFFYPLYDIHFERIVLFTNETLNISALFLIENLLFVLFMLIYADSKDIKINITYITFSAAIASGGVLSYFITSPSIDEPYKFVSGILLLTSGYIIITSYKRDVRYLFRAPIVSFLICLGYFITTASALSI